ncbi:MAG TPA: PAS domain-containing protein [Gammaproteobacteria bacterium]|nr:PAS domain-containing protein [Gammaproteobacteria bacterium]
MNTALCSKNTATPSYPPRPVGERRLAARLEGLLNVLPAGVVVLDGNGRIQQVNPAAKRLLGEPLLGREWIEVIRRAFAPQPGAGCDLKLADGRLVSLATCPLEGEAGQILLLNDVTETRTLQEQASRNQRLTAMGRMAAALAHQIRTPLSSAMLYASHLKRPELDGARRQELAERVLERMRHLEQLLNDMLLFAHGGLGWGERLAADALLRELYEAVEPQAREQHITLVAECDSGGGTVLGNRRLLLSALQNLVGNAMRAVGAGGTITLRLQRDGERRLAIQVADDGPGIPPELRERIFEPFVTGHGGGTGLGLAVARQVARVHHGDLQLASTPGGGSTFSLWLPLAEQSNQSDGRG